MKTIQGRLYIPTAYTALPNLVGMGLRIMCMHSAHTYSSWVDNDNEVKLRSTTKLTILGTDFFLFLFFRIFYPLKRAISENHGIVNPFDHKAANPWLVVAVALVEFWTRRPPATHQQASIQNLTFAEHIAFFHHA